MKNEKIILKKGKSIPYFYKHSWVFKGDIKYVSKDLSQGDIASLYDENDNFIGYGFYNEVSQISLKLFSFKIEDKIDMNFFSKKIDDVLLQRKNLFESNDTNSFRLVNSEGDFLPGLTIDLFNEYLSFQLSTNGLYKYLDEILDYIIQNLKEKYGKNIEGVIDNSDTAMLQKEGLDLEQKHHRGKLPEKPIQIMENGKLFGVDLLSSQKTGFYFDQRDNRLFLRNLFSDVNVLDCFCYTGGFSIYLSDKCNVLGVDSSKNFIQKAFENKKMNGDNPELDFLKSDVYEFLRHCKENYYDLIILDPPKYIKKSKDFDKGVGKYCELNKLAMQKVNEKGYIASCSCSSLLTEQDFEEVLVETAFQVGKNIQIIYKNGASTCHPVNPFIPESRYLKFILYRVL